MNEEEAVAIMAANLKGSKTNKPSNLVEFAEACRFLKQKWDNSAGNVAKFFKVSSYMVRQIDRINDLNPIAKKLVQQNEIGIDTAYQLSRLEKPKQVEASRYVKGLTAHQVRVLVDLVLEHPESSIPSLRKQIDERRDKKVHVLVLPIVESTYSELKEYAKLAKLSPHDLVLKLIEDSINEQKKESK